MGKNRRGKNTNANQNDDVRSVSVRRRNELNNLIDNLLRLSSTTCSSVKEEFELYLKIQDVLENIKNIEKAGKVLTMRDRSINFPALLKWVEENGGNVANVTIAWSVGAKMYYGLRATKDLKEGDLVCDIPRSVMMTLQDAKQSELKQLIEKDPMLRQMGNVALALFLILEAEKGTNSHWYTYISTLPTEREYVTVMYFTPHCMGQMKASPALEPVLKQCKSIARQYAYFSKVFRSADDAASVRLRGVFNYELYCWAVSTVMTRQNYVPVGDERVNALIPVWDMCNHADGYLATEYKSETDSSRCLSCRDVSSGGEVMIFYGPRTNAEFLVHNGFVCEDNKYDTYSIRLGVAKADPLYALRTQLLGTMRIPSSGEFFLRAGPEPVEGKLLAFLRIFNMDKEHLTHWIDCGRSADLTCIDCALDTEIENKAWKFLDARIRLLIHGYFQLPEPTHAVIIPAMEMKNQEEKLLRSASDYVQQRIKT